MLTRLAYAAATYTGLGLIGGLLYRELTRGRDWQFTQLNVVHTHLLALGTLVMLIALALEKLFALSRRRETTYFWWFYNAGLVLASAMMTLKGILQLDGPVDSKALAGVSGLGHIMLTVGLVFLFIALIKQVKAADAARTAVPRP
ncbi:DUF2871 domain-containing protein [Cumulibacter manganitolerans]|uniref:DUF2871 domain-containing protein n=1 Tax=Cumulibacter manganitolerans TaxID=1884992 RepID=UPI001294D4D8|nr:DUF2871 domain-containing protein [Cumulibacter manganitolerans]